MTDKTQKRYRTNGPKGEHEDVRRKQWWLWWIQQRQQRQCHWRRFFLCPAFLLTVRELSIIIATGSFVYVTTAMTMLSNWAMDAARAEEGSKQLRLVSGVFRSIETYTYVQPWYILWVNFGVLAKVKPGRSKARIWAIVLNDQSFAFTIYAGLTRSLSSSSRMPKIFKNFK